MCAYSMHQQNTLFTCVLPARNDCIAVRYFQYEKTTYQWKQCTFMYIRFKVHFLQTIDDYELNFAMTHTK